MFLCEISFTIEWKREQGGVGECNFISFLSKKCLKMLSENCLD